MSPFLICLLKVMVYKHQLEYNIYDLILLPIGLDLKNQNTDVYTP